MPAVFLRQIPVAESLKLQLLCVREDKSGVSNYLRNGSRSPERVCKLNGVLIASVVPDAVRNQLQGESSDAKSRRQCFGHVPPSRPLNRSRRLHIHSRTFTYIHTYIHTLVYTQTYIHIYIHTVLYTRTHIYIYTLRRESTTAGE